MRKMLVRETALVLAAAVLAAGTLASCRTDVPDDDIPYSPYLRIEKRNGIYVGGEYKHGVYVAYGIYGDRIPEDGKIVIPDGVELDETWCEVYDESNKWLRTLEVSDIKSISIPAGTDSMTFYNIPELAGWPSNWGSDDIVDIDIIYNGSLADWCEHGYLDSGLYRAKSIKIDGGHTDLKTLETLNIPGNVTKVNGTAFYRLGKFKRVTVPASVRVLGGYLSAELLEYKGEFREWCEIDRSPLYCDSIIIGERKTNLKTLEKITEADFAGAKRIGDGAFYGCEKLTSVDIPDSVTEIGGEAFSGCTGLTAVTIGKGVTKIGTYAFENCSSLTSVEIPHSVTEIGFSAFYGSGLTSVTIGKGVTKISRYAFEQCSSLTSVEIPDSVTEIGERAFSGCSGLTAVEIPHSVTEIGNSAFRNCYRLDSVTFAKTDGWYSVDLYGNKVSVDFSDPKNNASILKEEHPTYARKTE